MPIAPARSGVMPRSLTGRPPTLLGLGLALADQALVAGHVAQHAPALDPGLLAGLALLDLARRRGVRVGVGVQVVVGLGAVGGRAGGAADVVLALRRGDDDEALVGALAVALGVQAGQVAQQQADVVALRLRGGDERDRGVQGGGRVAQPLDAQRHQRVVGELLQAVEHARQVAVQRGRLRQRADTGLERVGQHRRGGGQGGHARPQLAEEGGAVAQERTLARELDRAGLQRGRALGDEVLQERPRHAGQGGEGGVQVGEQRGLGLGHRRHLRGRGLQRREQAVQARARAGQVPRHRLQVGQERLEGLDRGVQVVAAAREAGAEPVQRALRAAPGPRVEHVEDVVDLDRLGPCLARGDRGPGGEAGLGAARASAPRTSGPAPSAAGR